MKRSVIACVCVVLASAPAAHPGPTPPACAVTEQQTRCEAAAQIAGGVAYMVNGSAKFALYRGGVRRKCVVLGGHETGTLWEDVVQTGDVLRIDFIAGFPSAGIAGATNPLGQAGFGDQSIC